MKETQKYRKGERLFCKKETSIFKKGEYYTIIKVDPAPDINGNNRWGYYFNFDDINRWIHPIYQYSIDGLFYSEIEMRKLKLEEINDGNW